MTLIRPAFGIRQKLARCYANSHYTRRRSDICYSFIDYRSGSWLHDPQKWVTKTDYPPPPPPTTLSVPSRDDGRVTTRVPGARKRGRSVEHGAESGGEQSPGTVAVSPALLTRYARAVTRARQATRMRSHHAGMPWSVSGRRVLRRCIKDGCVGT